MRVRQPFTKVTIAAAAVLLPLGALLIETPPEPEWLPQRSGVTARLRGVSAASDTVCWASGTNGTILRTKDAGARWQLLRVPAADDLDFRDIDAVDDRTAYVLSIGSGEASRIYKTSDAGMTWTEQFVNRDPKAFFDAMAFWDAQHGIAVSDSVDGRFVIVTTRDGGRTWTRIADTSLPTALENEGAFAASGTNVAVHGTREVWIGTGAAARARVLRSRDRGLSWSVSDTPLRAGASAGIFSIAFRNATHGIVVGGDYKKEGDALDNAAITMDGGASWTLVKGLGGYRSAIAHVSGSRWFAVGPSGADDSADDGRTWKPARPITGLHAVSVARSGKVGWAVGEEGRIVRVTW